MSDPKGEFTSTKCAEPAYTLLGTTGLDQPDIDVSPFASFLLLAHA